MESVINTLIPFALAAVLLTLMAGIYTLFKGGDVSRSYSNKLMRLRVLLQFIAVMLMMAGLWFAS